MLVRKILRGSSPDGIYNNSIAYYDDINYLGDKFFTNRKSKYESGEIVWLDTDYMYYTPNPTPENPLSTDSSQTYTQLHLYWGSDVYQIENYKIYRRFLRLHCLK